MKIVINKIMKLEVLCHMKKIQIKNNGLIEYKQYQLNDLFVMKKGKGISKSQIDSNGKHPCIRYGELYTKYNEVIDEVYSRTIETDTVLSSEGDILIPSSGETAIDLATASMVNKDNISLGGDINILSARNGKVCPTYVAYALNNKYKNEIAKGAQGISVIHLYNAHLKSIEIEIPNYFVQEKHAWIVSSIDNLMRGVL